MLPRPRAVVFDAVGTLVHASPTVAEAYAAAAGRAGIAVAAADLHPKFKAAFARQEALDAAAHGQRTSPERERARWRSIVAEVFCTSDCDGLFDDLWAHFGEPAHWELDPFAVRACRELVAHGYALAVASNFDERLYPVLAGRLPGIEADRIFASSALGYRKPHVLFFRAIERSLELPPHELLYVGDSLENDLRGAQAAGWQALLLATEGDATANAPSVASLQVLVEQLCRT